MFEVALLDQTVGLSQGRGHAAPHAAAPPASKTHPGQGQRAPSNLTGRIHAWQ